MYTYHRSIWWTQANGIHTPLLTDYKATVRHREVFLFAEESFYHGIKKHQSYGQFKCCSLSEKLKGFPGLGRRLKHYVSPALRLWNFTNNIPIKRLRRSGLFIPSLIRSGLQAHELFFWFNLFCWMLVHFLKGIYQLLSAPTLLQKLYYSLIIMGQNSIHKEKGINFRG